MIALTMFSMKLFDNYKFEIHGLLHLTHSYMMQVSDTLRQGSWAYFFNRKVYDNVKCILKCSTILD